MKYKVNGEFVVGIKRKKFEVEVEANSENHAKTKVYSVFGAKNHVKRGKVNIKNVKVLE